jgi:LEA14-like dessication related protein
MATGLLLLVALSIFACGTKIVHRPEWRLHGVRIERIDTEGATLHVNVKVTNPNAFAIALEKVDYRLFFDKIEVAKGHKEGTVEFRPYQEVGIALPIEVDLKTILDQRAALREADRSAYRVEGEVTLKAVGIRKTFPFNEPEKAPARKEEKAE